MAEIIGSNETAAVRALNAQKNEVRAVLVNRGFIAGRDGNMSKIRKTGGATIVEFEDGYLGFTLIRRTYSSRGMLLLENHVDSDDADTRDMIALFPAL